MYTLLNYRNSGKNLYFEFFVLNYNILTLIQNFIFFNTFKNELCGNYREDPRYYLHT